jgi:DNA-binding GntR family transcriptional regulator
MTDTPIHTELKKRIILLDYKPGEVLREKAFMQEFGVSRTPVREAFIRLEQEGLVRMIPNLGTFVSEVSFQQLKDVFEIRSYLMRFIGQLAAARVTEAELAEMEATVERMRATDDPRELMRLDTEMHEIVNRATKNEALVKIVEMLRNQAVRIWSYSHNQNHYWDNLVAEFEALIEAFRRGDGGKSADILEMHTRHFVEHMRSQLAG